MPKQTSKRGVGMSKKINVPVVLIKDDVTVEAYEKKLASIKGENLIKEEAQKLKEAISKHAAEPEQEVLPFLPTTLTRLSPFFPMKRSQMKDRPYEILTYESGWGKLSVTN